MRPVLSRLEVVPKRGEVAWAFESKKAPDFSKFDKRFSNDYEIVGPEFGDLQAKREKFIAENRGSYRP